jgi:hypothetical protein
MTASRRAGLTYLLLTVFLAAVCVAVGYGFFENILDGKVYAGYRSTRRLVVASEDPVEFAIWTLIDLAVWLALCAYAWFRVAVWRKRHEHPEIFEAQVARLEKTTSKTGNVLAWILAVPFILLVLFFVAGYALVSGTP